jgi:prepilin-type N-terminal cleavage/methylation domain-containing protein
MNSSHFHPRARVQMPRAGFTLLEMLMAVTITTIITVALYSIFDQTQKAFRAGIAQVDVLEAARATGEIFDRDLAGLTVNPLEISLGRAALPTNLNFNDYPYNVWIDARSTQNWLGTIAAGTTVFLAQQNVVFFTRANDVVTMIGYYNFPMQLNWAGGSRPPTIPQISTLYRFTRTFQASQMTEALVRGHLATFRAGPLASINDPTRPFQEIVRGVIHNRWTPFGSNGQWWQNAADPLLAKFNPGSNSLSGLTGGGALVPAQMEYELMILQDDIMQQLIALAESNTAQARSFLESKLPEIHVIRKRVSTALFQ